jgi:hypothetical protein
MPDDVNGTASSVCRIEGILYGICTVSVSASVICRRSYREYAADRTVEPGLGQPAGCHQFLADGLADEGQAPLHLTRIYEQ